MTIGENHPRREGCRAPPRPTTDERKLLTTLKECVNDLYITDLRSRAFSGKNLVPPTMYENLLTGINATLQTLSEMPGGNEPSIERERDNLQEWWEWHYHAIEHIPVHARPRS